ncbi:MAG TPA: hypothetical protein VMH02_04980 [Verrucomicrobiae bacterium]|nr:hypothetical protein [Verrucomicrobiae bacterium]
MHVLLALLLAALQGEAAPASPVPSPSPAPTPRFSLSGSGSNVFIDQATGGPGVTPPEGPGFAKGSPVSPMSPYDWFTSAPVTPGVAGIGQYVLTALYHATGFDFSADFGFAGLSGSSTNALYWGEPLIPTIDDHALSHAIPYSIVFPTHAGQDDANLLDANLIGASVAAADGSWKVTGGYFNLTQSDRFVFAPPAITSVTPSLGATTAETLGPGMPSIDAWAPSPATLPLLGADGLWHHGSATLEISDALLPALAGTDARLTMGSLVDDRGEYGRYSLQIANIGTSGNPIETTTYFGSDQVLIPTPQGRFFTSSLANQDQSIGGARAFFHPLRGWDTLVELGRSWYQAGLVAEPGSSHYGNFEHYALTRHLGGDTATIEYHRFDPTYATVILPYGVPENVWSVAWSWPGVWLKSTYQIVDNSIIGANRAGFHFRYDHPSKTLEVHASYGDWRQLVPETEANASQAGFVDGFFLMQQNGFGTYGHDRQLGLYVAYHLPSDDLAFDGVEDYLDRDADPGQPLDAVAMRAPQLVASWTHHFGKKFLAVGGYGRYEMTGMWAITPVDAIYGLGFAGVQFATGPKTALLVEARRYGLVGLPSQAGGLPPAMHGSALIVDQRIAF